MSVVTTKRTMAADQRLRNLFSHLSPPVTLAALESPTAQLGRRRDFALEFEGPNSEREGKLLENLILSRLRRFDQRYDSSELSVISCRGELKSEGMAEGHAGDLQTREFESRDPESEEPRISERNGKFGVVTDSERGEQDLRRGIASASAVASSGAGEVQWKTNKSVRYLRSAACEFCDVIQGTSPCFKARSNPTEIPFSVLEATPPQVAAAMCAAVPVISKALLAATQCDSFNMLVNNGIAAGQVIMHTHFHLIPRCKGDGLWKSEGSKRKPLRKLQEAKLLAHTVRTNLSSTVGSLAR